MNKLTVVARRFTKGFIAGGLSSALVLIGQGVAISSVSDIKHFGIALVVAFLTGGLLSVEKYVNYQA